MIEVLRCGNRWRWRMICAGGRPLVWGRRTYDTDHRAFRAAKRYRTLLWAHAARIDHRMGACI